MQTNVQIDSKNLRSSPDPASVHVYDPRTKTLKVSWYSYYIVSKLEAAAFSQESTSVINVWWLS